MKNFLCILLIISSLILNSCRKEKNPSSSREDEVITELKINESTHTYVNNDGNLYYENSLKGFEKRQVYKVEMKKNVTYRIWTLMPSTEINLTRLTLVDIDNDTIDYSQYAPVKMELALTSPETRSYYIIVAHIYTDNSNCPYRLYFEELIDEPRAFSGQEWQCFGDWDAGSFDQITMTHHNTYILRHLNLTAPITENKTVSFMIQSSVPGGTNFGIATNISPKYAVYGDYMYELPSYSKTFLTGNNVTQSAIITIRNSYQYGDFYTMEGANSDFTSGVTLKLVLEGNAYSVYFDNIYRGSLGLSTLGNISLLVEDIGSGVTVIKDFKIF